MSHVWKLRTDQLLWREVDDSIVILDQDRSVYFAVQGAGTALWDLLLEGSTDAQLAQHLVETFTLDHEQAAADVRAFLSDVRDAGLLIQTGAVEATDVVDEQDNR